MSDAKPDVPKAEVEAKDAAPAADAPAAPDAKPSLLDKAKGALTGAVGAVGNAKQGFMSRFSGKGMLIVSIAILTLVLGAIVGLGIYYLFKKFSVRINTYILPESKVPVLGNSYAKMNGAEIPRAYNGRRMTLAFWIYINDINKYHGTYRHVLHRGDDNIQGASPLVFLDKHTNKLHVRFDSIKTPTTSLTMQKPFNKTVTVDYTDRSGGSATEGKFTGDIKDAKDALEYDLTTHGITIDYIPLQRWVHVAIVVNEDVNGGMISAYVDSELVKHVQSNAIFKKSLIITGKSATAAATVAAADELIPVSTPINISGLNLDKIGDVYVGGDGSSNAGPGFSGLVAGIKFANYDLNQEDVYKMYIEGPVDNLAAKLGLPAYGVRAPVYRLA
jgi:hypothetical protein